MTRSRWCIVPTLVLTADCAFSWGSHHPPRWVAGTCSLLRLSSAWYFIVRPLSSMPIRRGTPFVVAHKRGQRLRRSDVDGTQRSVSLNRLPLESCFFVQALQAGGTENERATARKENESMPAGDTDDSETPQVQGVPAAAGANPSPSWQVQWKIKRLIICDGSLCCQDRAVFFDLQWHRYWKATFGSRCEVTTTPASTGHTASCFSS